MRKKLTKALGDIDGRSNYCDHAKHHAKLTNSDNARQCRSVLLACMPVANAHADASADSTHMHIEVAAPMVQVHTYGTRVRVCTTT